MRKLLYPNSLVNLFLLDAIAFFIGLSLWNVWGIIVFVLKVPAIFAFFAGFALFIFRMQGRDWEAEYKSETAGDHSGSLGYIFITFTGLGAIYTLYWTGNAVLKKLIIMEDVQNE